MKKLATLTLLSGMIALLMSSCQSTNRGYQSAPVIARAVTLDPIKADIKVDETKKLTGSSSSAYLLFFRIKGDKTMADGINYSTDASQSAFARMNPLNAIKAMRLGKVRGAAAYKAMEGTDHDVLVHPTYQITVKDYIIYKKYEVTVEGYGATYTNFRTEKQKVVITGDKEYVFPEVETKNP